MSRTIVSGPLSASDEQVWISRVGKKALDTQSPISMQC